ncbi:sulfatase-like hydrolase/transferase [bacterium]|nr:sulfatase-like hydrolase/transferase [bacterium]
MKKRNPFLINLIITILYIFFVYKTSIVGDNFHFYVILFLLYPTMQIVMLSKSRGFTVLLKSMLFFLLYFNVFSVINYAFIETISKQIHSKTFFSLAITLSIIALITFFTISIPILIHYFKTELGFLDILIILLNLFLIYLELKLIGSDILTYYHYFLTIFTLFLLLYIIRYLLIFRKWIVPLKSATVLVLIIGIFIANYMNKENIMDNKIDSKPIASNKDKESIQSINNKINSTELIDSSINKNDENNNNKTNSQEEIALETSKLDTNKNSKFNSINNNKKYNILLITIDCLTPYHLDSYGYRRETSPNLTKFSKDSLFFKKAFSQGNNTLPAIGSFMTSKYTTEIFWKDYKRFLPIKEENLLLAEVLNSNGYYTAGITTHSYFLPNFGFQQGFENWDISLISTKGEIAFEQETSRSIFEKSTKLIDTIPEDKAFFMWLHFFDPHDSYVKRDEGKDFGDSVIDIFDNEIHYTDIYVGKLFDYLKQKNLYDNTIIIITGDHGEAFGDHGYDKHGRALYNDQIWVPLMIRFPDMQPQIIEQEVAHIDIFPTLLDYLNIDLPDGKELSGISLFDRIGNSENPPVFSMSYRHGKEEYSMIYKGYKIIYFYKQNIKKIYNIQDDFGEENDLSSESPEILYELSKKLSIWIKKQKDSYKNTTSTID